MNYSLHVSSTPIFDWLHGVEERARKVLTAEAAQAEKVGILLHPSKSQLESGDPRRIVTDERDVSDRQFLQKKRSAPFFFSLSVRSRLLTHTHTHAHERSNSTIKPSIRSQDPSRNWIVEIQVPMNRETADTVSELRNRHPESSSFLSNPMRSSGSSRYFERRTLRKLQSCILRSRQAATV